jgi:predicted phage terminase large subunit-like protein
VSDRQAALLALLRQDLPSFVAKCFATLEPGGSFRENWHILHLAHQLTRVSDGEVKRLIINIPPRHLKSICVTVAYTAWVMGHDPRLKIIALSYGSELAEELARHFRTVVESAWYRAAFPSFQIKRARRGEIVTTLNGSRYACGLDGSILGRGADLIVIDDPQKAQAAFSESERRKANNCYDNTISTRLNNKKDGAIVVVMQRLHEDDLVGHVLGKEDWEVSTIPAIAVEDQVYRTGPEPTDLYRRRAGELILPEREDEATLAAQRRLLGSMGFEAQYQQNPVPPDGNASRRQWLRYYDAAPALDLTVISWDTASTLHADSDWSVGTVWGLKGSDVYLLDVVRGRYEMPELRRLITATTQRHGAQATLIEDTDIGRAIIQEMRRHGPVRPIRWPARLEKEARLLAQAPMFEAGQVLLPREAPWLATYVSELLAFPNAKHDDQVDSTSQGLNWLSQKIAYGVPPRRPNPPRPQGYRTAA